MFWDTLRCRNAAPLTHTVQTRPAACSGRDTLRCRTAAPLAHRRTTSDSGACAQPIPPPLLTALGGAAGVLRWGIMGAVPELPFWGLVATQALHGLTFAAVHLGTVGFLGVATPPTLRSSAQV